MSGACFETPRDGLADILQGLGLCASLGDTARKGRTLGDEHAGLVRLQRHKQLHTWILLHLASADGSQTSLARYRWAPMSYEATGTPSFFFDHLTNV